MRHVRSLRPALLTAALCAALASGCSHGTIAGTQIADTDENRAVLEVLGKYKQAAEGLDTKALVDLAAPTYFDRGTNSRGNQPVNLAALQKSLGDRFGRVKALRMEITVKDVRVAREKAEIDYFLVMHFALDLPAGEKWKSESDDQRMVLARVGDAWKVQSGL